MTLLFLPSKSGGTSKGTGMSLRSRKKNKGDDEKMKKQLIS
jgi:hypothetical protein